MSVVVDTELRKLDVGVIANLAHHLECGKTWKTLMSSVTTPETKMQRFTVDDIGLIEEAARQQQRIPAEIFLNEWSTMGKKRPTVGQVIQLLAGKGLFRAADYLAVDVLNGSPPPRPRTSALAEIDVSQILNEQMLNESDSEGDTAKEQFCNRSTAEMNNADLIRFSNSVEQSDLIKFSTNTIHSEINEGLIQRTNLMPHFTQLGIALSKSTEQANRTVESSSTDASVDNSSSPSTSSPVTDDGPYLPALSLIAPGESSSGDLSEIREGEIMSEGSSESQEIPLVVKQYMPRR